MSRTKRETKSEAEDRREPCGQCRSAHQEKKSEQKTEMEKHEVLRLNNLESNRLTRECFEMALVYLMGEKPFDKITVTELVQRSGASRTAFYRNYKSKGDILKEIGDELSETIRVMLERPEYLEDPYQWYMECFTVAKEKAEIIQLLMRAHISFETLFGNNSILDMLYPLESYPERYLRLAAEAAFHEILRVWIDGGMKESVEDMAGICCDIFQKAQKGAKFVEPVEKSEDAPI